MSAWRPPGREGWDEESAVAAYVLLIDDDLALVESMQPVLASEGYRVECAAPNLKAIRKMLLDEPQLVILGVNPRQEGWQFCQRLLPFLPGALLLLLSADDEEGRMKGLRLGADDCLFKPVAASELVARVRTLLRRRESVFVDGELVVDLARQEVWLDDRPVALTPTEFRLFACLVRHAGRVVSPQRLAVEVWGPEQSACRQRVTRHIHHLRQKLEPDPRHPRRIVTCLGEGYLLQRTV